MFREPVKLLEKNDDKKEQRHRRHVCSQFNNGGAVLSRRKNRPHLQRAAFQYSSLLGFESVLNALMQSTQKVIVVFLPRNRIIHQKIENIRFHWSIVTVLLYN